MKNLYLIVGPSGSGKTTATEELSKRYGYRTVSSMTTRPKRTPDEVGHEFVSQADFDAVRDQLVAYTKINGAEYGVTADTLDRSDLYVIDWPGVVTLRERYDRKPLKIIFLRCPASVCAERMRMRGDTEEKIKARLDHDGPAFAIDPIELDANLNANCSVDEVISKMQKCIEVWEKP